MKVLKLAQPTFGDDAVDMISEVLRSGRLSDGPKVADFERAIAHYCGTAHAVAASSATTALELILAALDVTDGDEVVVADFTYPATANAALQRGASVRLVDIDLATFCVDPEEVARVVTERTAAIVAVDVFGLPAAYDELAEVAASYEIPLVCDAACSLGAVFRGRPAGTLGTAACFSFHPRKSLTTGEGGMVTTDDPELAERMRRLRNHGSVRHEWESVFEEPGFNFRLSEIQAALGLAQVEQFEAVVERRNALAERLSDALKSYDGVAPQAVPSGLRHAYQAYVVLLDAAIDRDAMIRGLRAVGIEATLGTYALHAQPAYATRCGVAPGDLANSWTAYRQSLALPLHQGLSVDDVARIGEEVGRALAECRR